MIGIGILMPLRSAGVSEWQHAFNDVEAVLQANSGVLTLFWPASV